MKELQKIDINGVDYEISDKKAQTELADARVDNGGNVHATAGDAIRALESKVESNGTGVDALKQSVSQKASVQLVHWEEDD